MKTRAKAVRKQGTSDKWIRSKLLKLYEDYCVYFLDNGTLCIPDPLDADEVLGVIKDLSVDDMIRLVDIAIEVEYGHHPGR
jgi:hypothetical protein